MTVTQVPLRPIARGSLFKLMLAIAGVALAAFLLARLGTEPFRAETTATGLQFREIKAGSGDVVKAIDGVYIIYEGRLADGTVFDSSQGRPVPMIPGQVIPGFSEALQKMQKGGRYSVRIPAALAYGASPPPNSPIPANADLVFDVEVVELVPNAALTASQGAPQGAAPTDPTAPPPL